MRIIGTHEELEKIKVKCSTVSDCKHCVLSSFCGLLLGCIPLFIEANNETMDYIETYGKVNFDISIPTLLIQKGGNSNEDNRDT